MKSVLTEKKNEDRLWTTEKVESYKVRMAQGEAIKGGNPFFENDIRWRRKDLAFEYTEEEIDEIKKCLDPVNGLRYFANTHCQVRKPTGLEQIILRDYQERILDAYLLENYIVLCSGRQSGKTVASAIFIVHCLCFNTDFGVLVAADKMDTAKDILNKVYAIMENLPFFLKPGVNVKNVYQMTLDNGCQIKGVATNENAGIGFTTNLLYVDEYARVDENLAVEFWRAVYPTLSANADAKAIITSTANGPNHFYKLFIGAKNKEGNNRFFAIEIDWREVPRGMPADDFREQEISNFGNGNREEGVRQFEQEYGNKFFQDGRLLLSGESLRLLNRIEKNYIHVEIPVFEDQDLPYSGLLWSPLHKDLEFEPHNRFVISVDLANGVNKDYTVFNIFMVTPRSLASIKAKRNFEDIYDFFTIQQIGIFRSNVLSVNEVSPILEILVFDFFGADNCRVVVEMNYKGEQLINNLSEHNDCYDNIFLHTRHRSNSKILEPGVFIHKENKPYFCRELRKLVHERQIIFDEFETIKEMKGFSLNKTGGYSCEIGHDDIAMTCVILVPFIDSEWFEELVDEIIPHCNPKLIDAMIAKLENDVDDGKRKYNDESDDSEFLKW